jgi:hypothetical protein
MQRDAGVPSVVVLVVEALIILGLIVAWPLDVGGPSRRREDVAVARRHTNQEGT